MDLLYFLDPIIIYLTTTIHSFNHIYVFCIRYSKYFSRTTTGDLDAWLMLLRFLPPDFHTSFFRMFYIYIHTIYLEDLNTNVATIFFQSQIESCIILSFIDIFSNWILYYKHFSWQAWSNDSSLLSLPDYDYTIQNA